MARTGNGETYGTPSTHNAFGFKTRRPHHCRKCPTEIIREKLLTKIVPRQRLKSGRSGWSYKRVTGATEKQVGLRSQQLNALRAMRMLRSLCSFSWRPLA